MTTALLRFGRCRGAEALELDAGIGLGWLVVLFYFSASTHWYVSEAILSHRHSLRVAGRSPSSFTKARRHGRGWLKRLSGPLRLNHN
jgi:hypothetical protein